MLSLDITAQAGDLTLSAATTVGNGVTALFGPSGCGKTTFAQGHCRPYALPRHNSL